MMQFFSRRFSRRFSRLCPAAAVTVLLAACAARAPLIQQQQCYDPEAQLVAALRELDARRAAGCDAAGGEACLQARAAVERQLAICPVHVPTLMANAVLAYDERRPIVAQQLLDQILSPPGTHPDAAVLRAQIAIEEGNLPFARRLLEQQLKFAPDHAGLHETSGALFYLTGQMTDARRQLTTALALGAPAWRVAYHLGLVAEALAFLEEAEKHYAEAVKGNPGWQPAQSRLRALRLTRAP